MPPVAQHPEQSHSSSSRELQLMRETSAHVALRHGL